MKKIGLLALALCVAGAASAVTFDWSSDHQIGNKASATDGVSGATKGMISVPYVSTAGSVVYYGAAVTGKGPGVDNAHRVVFGIGDGTKNTGGTTSGQSISVNIGKDGKLYLYQNGAGQGVSEGTTAGTSLDSTTDAVLAASGAASTSAYLVLAIDRTNADGNATVTLYSSDADGSLNEVLITADNVSITGDLDTVYAVDYYGSGGGSRWGGGDSVEVYATLPEPTALALLALGVAGVALRRRVA